MVHHFIKFVYFVFVEASMGNYPRAILIPPFFLSSSISFVFLLPLLLLFSSTTQAAPLETSAKENITIEAPSGSRYLSDGDILCAPATWKSISVFFFANYVAHAFTVKSTPGQTMLLGFLRAISALLLPIAGSVSGIEAIRRHAAFGSDPLDRVSRAGGLCAVVRTGAWTAQDKDIIRGFHSCSKDSERFMTSCGTSCGLCEPLRKEVREELAKEERSKAKRQEKKKTRMVNLNRVAQRNTSDVRSAEIGQPPGASTRPGLSSPQAEVVETFAVEDLPSSTLMHFLPAKGTWSLHNRIVHGSCCLPPGYALARLPPGSKVHPLPNSRENQSKQVFSTIPDLSSSKKKEALNLHNLREKLDHIFKARGESNSTGYVANEITAVYSPIKAILAILQTVFAAFTLFETRGDQVSRYGYAAFGLTVTPYLTMSVVNLLGILLTPEYPSLYLVKNDVLEEASRRPGGHFEGVVAQVGEDFDEDCPKLSFMVDSHHQTWRQLSSNDGDELSVWEPTERYKRRSKSELGGLPEIPPAFIVPAAPVSACRLYQLRWAAMLVYFILVAIISVATFFVLLFTSGFSAGTDSTVAQRVLTMTWLGVSVASGIGIVAEKNREDDWFVASAPTQLFLISAFIPAIGGFVVVGQMLAEYGSCNTLY